MHLLHDENGNVIPHGHGGEHCHHHDEAHCDRHEGDHCEVKEGGACPHGGHEHHHDHGPMNTKEQMAALLDYMLKHNQSHAAELDKMAARLNEENMPEAAEQVRKAVDEFTKGNLYLSLALSSVKEA
ncbi:MAG: cobalt transporter [Lachnospiraceae bacterium]|nr:cobalt transporter [Lachnospiraceae bacterium]